MGITRLPGKRKISMGLKDDSITPPRQAQQQLAPGAKVLQQTGKPPHLLRDQTRSALPPGKRISKTGKEYWESRKNRSDVPGSNL